MAPLFLPNQDSLLVGLFCVHHPPPERSPPLIHIRDLQDLSIIKDDPELYREVASYILYCRFEMLEDEEDIDDHDFSISVFYESDLLLLNDLGPPKETAVTVFCKKMNMSDLFRYSVRCLIFPKLRPFFCCWQLESDVQNCSR